jgi:uncharacterized protein DUF397
MTFHKSSHSVSGGCVEVEIQYRKSSKCSGGDCVEVGMGYVKSSHCHSKDCVEVGTEHTHTGEIVVRVRDSKQTDLDGKPNGPVLEFNQQEWEAFLLGVEAGEFRIALPGGESGDSAAA